MYRKLFQSVLGFIALSFNCVKHAQGISYHFKFNYFNILKLNVFILTSKTDIARKKSWESSKRYHHRIALFHNHDHNHLANMRVWKGYLEHGREGWVKGEGREKGEKGREKEEKRVKKETKMYNEINKI